MTLISTDENSNDKVQNNPSIEEGNDDAHDNTESKRNSVLEKSSDECLLKFQNRSFFSIIFLSAAIAAVIVCISYEKAKNHQGDNITKLMKDFDTERLMLKHEDNHGPDHMHSHPKKDEEDLVKISSTNTRNILSSSSIISDYFEDNSLSTMDVVDAKVVDFMFQQQDIIKLLQMPRSTDLSDSDLTVGEKITQRFVMLSLWGSLSNFETAFPINDECDWDGVDCDDGVVEEIEFARRGWEGVIPSDIGHLKKLEYIDFAQNRLKGSIPEQFYKLVNLEEIYLHENQLTGTLSESIENLEDLKHLLLCRNKFTGTLPRGLEETSLKLLSLCYNQLTGTLPTLDLDDVKYMDLSHNNLSGTIGSSVFDDYNGLDHLYLDYNNFRGTIPESLVAVGRGSAFQLYLSNNAFTGTVPTPEAWIRESDGGWNNKLTTLELHNNNFDARLSRKICFMSVFSEGDMVELSADCNVCRCNVNSRMCDYCRS